jgi:hypothetical protein
MCFASACLFSMLFLEVLLTFSPRLLNKLRAANAVRPDPREDGFVRTTNVTKFLAGCSSYGLAEEDLFQREDLMEATPESLTRVAKTIIALIQFIESPDQSRILSGQGKKSPIPGPYSSSSRTAGATSTPNLASSPSSPRALSPASPRKVSALSASRPEKLDDPPPQRSPRAKSPDVYEQGDGGRRVRLGDMRNSPVSISPPPRSPLRAKSSSRGPLSASPDDGADLFTTRNPSSSSARRPLSPRETVNGFQDSTIRQSVASTASTAMSDSTTTTTLSSLLDTGRKTSSGFNKFGTVRTMTTDATSEFPSMTRTEASSAAEDLRKRTESASSRLSTDRKLSNNTSTVDLTRVVEEAEDAASMSSGGHRGLRKASQEKPTNTRGGTPAIRLGKGKWPDDFMDALDNKPASKTPSPDLLEEFASTSSSTNTPPRKLAIVGGGHRGSESVESLPQFPRRPSQSHRMRQGSADITSGLLPKESVTPPDGLPSSLGNPSRIMVRRSSKTQTRGQLLPRSSLDEPKSPTDTNAPGPIPFPQANVSTVDTTADNSDGISKRPVRGRFQSDVQGSAGRVRPSSYDELGARPSRTRIESMANIGATGSGSTTASDLMARNAIEDSAVRMALIVREEGKLPTHFVSLFVLSRWRYRHC